MTLPSFLIIGAPKAGTSTLKHALYDHPQVLFANDAAHREPHFLSYASDGWPHWAVKDQAGYEELFDGPAQDKAVGEKSTWYLYSQGAAQHAAKLMPGVKAIALLRDPVARAYSSYRFNRQMGLETASSFAEALDLEENRREFRSAPDLHYLKTGLYAKQVKRWIDALGRDQVQVLIFEDILHDRQAHFHSACEFLGVEKISGEPVVHRNKTSDVRSPRIKQFLKRAGKQYAWLPKPLKRLGSEALQRINRTSKPPVLDEAVAARLAGQFHSDVQELSEMVGRDLTDLWLAKYSGAS